VVFVSPNISGCWWVGIASVGLGGAVQGFAWINGRNTTPVYSHELGHNFGLLHAGSLRCSHGAITGGCIVAEYGDLFDTMGNNQPAWHYNAYNKRSLGWIPANAVATHSGGSTTYSLTPTELAGGSLYAVRVPVASNRTYWVEYRQPIGFDAALASYPNNGAQVRVTSPFETTCNCTTQLLDMTPRR
jgi:hypothetical protein